MKLNRVEKALMNNPVRSALQRWYEAPLMQRLGGRTEGLQVLEVGCGRGVGTEIILQQFGAASVHAFDLDPDMVRKETLPPYDVLDAILGLYIEGGEDIAAIASRGLDGALVGRIAALVDGNEFKRSQAAPTIRITTKAFGSGRQMPIAQGWTRSRLLDQHESDQ